MEVMSYIVYGARHNSGYIECYVKQLLAVTKK